MYDRDVLYPPEQYFHSSPQGNKHYILRFFTGVYVQCLNVMLYNGAVRNDGYGYCSHTSPRSGFSAKTMSIYFI